MKIIKKLSALFLAVLLLTAMFPAGAAASSSAYDKAVDAIDAASPRTQGQMSRYDAGFSHRITGICNVSSMVTLLNRRLAYDGSSDSFTVKKVLRANGCTDIVVKGDKCSYTGDTDRWYDQTYATGGMKYTAVKLSSDTVRRESTRSNFPAYLALLLHEHPEGVALRSASAFHVAVIYKYKMVGGSIQLYVKDPAEDFSGKLEDSYIYKQSGGDLYGGLDCIVYLEGSAPVSPMQAKKTSVFAGKTRSIAPCVGGSCASYVSSDAGVCAVNDDGQITGASVGKASVTVRIKTGPGKTWKYKVSVTVLGCPKISSVKSAKSGRATVRWTPVDGVSGYQIQYSLSKSFSGGKTVRRAGADTSSATLRSLKAGKTYYIRIRAYRTGGGATVYSPWSTAKTVRIKTK